jgi:molybdate transport system substrate-binding protein
MAAASLSGAMPAVVEAFEGETGARVDLVLGATGNLASQVENGAPADLFFAADEMTVDRMIASGALRAATRRIYAEGGLALVWGAYVTEPPASLQSLTDGRFAVIGIANPELAPYGAAAREALQTAGVWDEVEDRVVYGENISQTYQFVATGNADAVLVAMSIALEGDSTRYLPIDGGMHRPIRHAAAVVAASVNPLAASFLDYVTGPTGSRILEGFGFRAAVPGP